MVFTFAVKSGQAALSKFACSESAGQTLASKNDWEAIEAYHHYHHSHDS